MDNVIESYLIALGVDIDKSDFAEADRAVNQLSTSITSHATQWVKASGIVVGAITGIVGSITGLVASAAKQDLAMQKYATSMMISTNQAVAMKEALDALGESAADVQTNMELRSRYNALLQDAQAISPDSDYGNMMKQVRDVMFEFTRLKQAASYAIKWISYYLVKDFIGPLDKAGFSLRSLNEYIQRNLPRITRNVADGLGYLINIGLNFMRALKSLGSAVLGIWDKLPHSIKVATIAMGAFFALLRASPIGRLVAVIGGLLLLLDDFYAYMDGKESELGPYWEKLIQFWDSISGYVDLATDAIVNFVKTVSESSELSDFLGLIKETASVTWELITALGTFVSDTLRELWSALQEQGVVGDFNESIRAGFNNFIEFEKSVLKVIQSIAKFLRTVGKTEEFKQFIALLATVLSIIWEIVTFIVGTVIDAFKGLFKIFKDLGVPKAFTSAMKELFMAIVELSKGAANLIKILIKVFKWLVGDPRVMPFWKGVGTALGGLVKVLSTVLSKLGKIGRVIGLLLQGKFAEAAAEFGTAIGLGSSIDINNTKLGALSQAYEGNPGTVGGGSGGSYGSWQIIAANMPDFLENYLANSNPEYYRRLKAAGPVGSESFNDEWRSIGESDSDGFREDQRKYIAATHYATQVNKVRAKTGMDITQQSRAVQEAVWSAAVQQGPHNSVIVNAINRAGGAGSFDMSEESQAKLLKAIYETRKGYTANDEGVDPSQLVKRYNQELKDALSMLHQEATEWAQHEQKLELNSNEQKMLEAGEKGVLAVISEQASAMGEIIKEKVNSAGEWIGNHMPSLSFADNKLPTYAFAGSNSTSNVSNSIGDIIVHVHKANANANDIGNAVGNTVAKTLNMPKRPIVSVRERRGAIG